MVGGVRLCGRSTPRLKSARAIYGPRATTRAGLAAAGGAGLLFLSLSLGGGGRRASNCPGPTLLTPLCLQQNGGGRKGRVIEPHNLPQLQGGGQGKHKNMRPHHYSLTHLLVRLMARWASFLMADTTASAL